MDAVSRKRPASTSDAGPSQVKKRALSTTNGLPGRASPVNNDDSDTLDPPSASLENFRKEAIFRRMRQHARERERSEHRASELEKRKRELEGTVGAIENCWNQVLNQLQMLCTVDSLPSLPTIHVPDLLKLIETHNGGQEAPTEEFRKALLEDGVKTQSLVANFVSMTPRTAPDYDELLSKCQEATMRATSLRSELHIIHANFVDAEAQLARYKENLTQAENRLENAKRQMQMDLAARPEGSDAATRAQSGTPHPMDATETSANGEPAEHSDDLDLLRARLQKAEAEIKYLGEQKTAAEQRYALLKVESEAKSAEVIKEFPAFIALSETVAALKAQLQEARDETKRIAEQTTNNLNQIQLAKNQEIDHLQTELASFQEKFESKVREINKVKEARDVANQTLAVLKVSEQTKLQDYDSVIMRAKSLEERAEGLSLEVKRLKSQLAAQTGDAELLDFVLSSGGKEDVFLIKDLQAKLSDAKSRLAALEATLESLDASHPEVSRHLRSEAEAREELGSIRAELEKYQRIFGSDLSGDAKLLADRLKESERTVEQLRLQQQQEAASSNDLFEELQRMSSAWEILEKQSKERIDDAAAWESRFGRVSVEKAKAEQKYFATMREREALEIERKSILRANQQQSMLVGQMTTRQATLEEEVKLARNLSADHEALAQEQKKLTSDFEAELIQLKSTKEQQTSELSGLREQLKTALEDTEKARQSTRRLEDEIAKTRKLAEKDVAKAAKAAVQPQDDSQEQQLLAILRCSTCNQRLRSHVLIKCLHTFCHDCLEARLTTRQRKCPACGLKFQDSDMQKLFFQ